MAKVLISFIGKGRMEDKQTRRYVPTTYAFSSDPGGNVSVSLFGAGLLQHLSRTEGLIERWLVVGTEQSMWEALLDAVPKERRDEVLLSSHRRIGECVQACTDGKAALDETVLEQWQKDLTDRLDGTECRCRVVGSCDTLESQQKLWQALDEGVPLDSSVCMDVTHCYRILPILGSFMVMFLRWERSVKDIDLVYGAWEMRSGDGICPVIHLPLCNELLQASEAVATLRYTGNYVPLAQCLDQLGSADQTGLTASIERTAFLDDIQHLKPAVARETAARIREQTAAPSNSIALLLREALQQAQGRSAERLGRKAKRAMQHHQYMQAIVLLWESIRLVAVELYLPEATRRCYSAREEAEDKLYGRHKVDEEGKVLWDYRESPGLNPAAQQSLRLVEYLRNAVVHGAQPNRPAGGSTAQDFDEVQKALRSVEDFIRIFEGGREVLEDLLARQAGEGPDS